MADVAYRVETVFPVAAYSPAEQRLAMRIAATLGRGVLLPLIPPAGRR